MKSLKERFEEKVEMIPECGCWIWTSSTHYKGYACFWYKSKNEKGHRVAWEIYNGPIPHGKHVLHRCDTPACVNPNHLFLGDNFINQQDCAAKGRHKGPNIHGEKHHFAKLTEVQVLQIEKDKRPQWKIGKDYNISQPIVSEIKNHKIWKHLWDISECSPIS